MRIAEEMELQKAGEAIASALRGKTFGSITVDEVDVDLRADAFGEPAVFVVAWSSSPQQMRRTRRGKQRRQWANEDRYQVTAAFADALSRLDREVNAYFSLVAGERRPVESSH